MDVETVIKNLSGDFFSALANLLEIVGFILTVIVFFSVRKIKERYIFKVKVPEQTDKLDKHASAISRFHDDFPNSLDAIRLELRRTEGTIQLLRKKVNKPTQQSLDEIPKLIKEYRARAHDSPLAKRKLYDVYIELRKVVDDLIDLQQEVDLER